MYYNNSFAENSKLYFSELIYEHYKWIVQV